MEIRPILSAMFRNKTGVVLVGLQIALTLAVVANAAFIIVNRLDLIHRPYGFDSDNLIVVQSFGYGPTYDQRETVRRDLDTLRAIPGVVAASSTNGVPMSGSGSQNSFGIVPDPDKIKTDANIYELDEQGVAAFGAKLVEGRAFTREEIQFNPSPTNSDFVPAVIITRDMARALFGNEPALGKQVYEALGGSATVVGVIDDMLGAWVGFDAPFRVMFQPRIPSGPLSRYLVRVEPGRRDAMIPEIEKQLSAANLPRAITWVRGHDYYVERSYRADSRMVTYLGIIVALMIIITALGVVGLASFQVNVRTKQIGTRRAVGARRIDIIRYFMVENSLLTLGGVIAGAVFAFAFGEWLSSAYALPRLDPMFVAAGVVMLLILGQLAVFVPARRAAAIPPAIATRTV
jgi:putative ABC transport system permease protein